MRPRFFAYPAENGTNYPRKVGSIMMIGTVLDRLELLRGLPGAVEQRWVRVRCGSNLLTALDLVGTHPGELVLLITGDSAGRLSQDLPVDAVILGVAGKNG